MKTQILDSAAKRIAIAGAVLVGFILLVAGIYTFFGGSAPAANGPKIISAVHAYTHALVLSHASVPPSIPLKMLVDEGLLQPSDVGSFQGLDATIFLTAKTADKNPVLLRVRMPDGMDLLLHTDGSSQEVKR